MLRGSFDGCSNTLERNREIFDLLVRTTKRMLQHQMELGTSVYGWLQRCHIADPSKRVTPK